jgi:hypothetical protein
MTMCSLLEQAPTSNMTPTTATMKKMSSTTPPAKLARILHGLVTGRDEEIQRLAATTCGHRLRPELMLQ